MATDFKVFSKVNSSLELFIKIAISVNWLKLFIVVVLFEFILVSEAQLLKSTILSILKTSLIFSVEIFTI